MVQATAPKTYSLVALILILGCIVGGYMIMTNFWPAYNDTKALQSQAEAESARLNKSLSSVQTFLNTYRDEEKNAARLNLALPNGNADMANFVSSLPQLASASGIVLTNFQVSDTEDDEDQLMYGIVSVDLSLSLAGTYLSFKDFMLRLEKHLRIVDVSNVSLSSGSNTGSASLSLLYQVRLKTYYQK